MFLSIEASSVLILFSFDFLPFFALASRLSPYVILSVDPSMLPFPGTFNAPLHDSRFIDRTHNFPASPKKK